MPLAMSMDEPSALTFKRGLYVSCAWSNAWLQRARQAILSWNARPGQRQPTNVKAIQPYDVAIMQLRHENKKLGLRAGILSNDLMHAL
jgi:hypothetical protein